MTSLSRSNTASGHFTRVSAQRTENEKGVRLCHREDGKRLICVYGHVGELGVGVRCLAGQLGAVAIVVPSFTEGVACALVGSLVYKHRFCLRGSS